MLGKFKKTAKKVKAFSAITFSDPGSCQQCPKGKPNKTNNTQKSCK